MQRFASIIRLKPGCLEAYRAAHAALWPEVERQIRACNLRNYSIFHRDGQLYSYFEYAGEDFEADMARVDAHPECKKWKALMDAMQEPVAGAPEGVWWCPLEEVFHLD